MFQHSPTLRTVDFGTCIISAFATTAFLFTTTTVPANTAIVFSGFFRINATNVGTVTISWPNNSVTFQNAWVSNGEELATLNIRAIRITESIPSGTTITITRTAGNSLGFIQATAMPGVTQIQNYATVATTLSANQQVNFSSNFTSGTVVVPDFRKSNVSLSLMASASTSSQVQTVGLGGQVGYGQTANGAIQYFAGNTNTAFVLATSIWHYANPSDNQLFAVVTNATNGGTWIVGTYRFVGG